MLLLFEQLIKSRLLVGRESFAKLGFSALDFLMQLGSDRLHELASALLALLEDFVDALALVGGEVEVPLHSPKEFEAHAAG